jgi:hypothetical protein
LSSTEAEDYFTQEEIGKQVIEESDMEIEFN